MWVESFTVWEKLKIYENQKKQIHHTVKPGKIWNSRDHKKVFWIMKNLYNSIYYKKTG
jgi:hypothetical protein